MYLSDGEVPCYVILVEETHIDAKNIAQQLESQLKECLDEYNWQDIYSGNNNSEETMLQFSVTSREKNYEEWLDIAESVPGSTICMTQRKRNSLKPYYVYFCCVPLDPMEHIE